MKPSIYYIRDLCEESYAIHFDESMNNYCWLNIYDVDGNFFISLREADYDKDKDRIIFDERSIYLTEVD